MAKEVSTSSYKWAHIGVIIFHSLIAIMFYYATKNEKTFGYESVKVIRAGAIVLLVVSLLGLIPILKHDELIID